MEMSPLFSLLSKSTADTGGCTLEGCVIVTELAVSTQPVYILKAGHFFFESILLI